MLDKKAVETARKNSLGYLVAIILFPNPLSFICARKMVPPHQLVRETTLDIIYLRLTYKDVRSIAFQLARCNDIPHSFSLLHAIAGRG